MYLIPSISVETFIAQEKVNSILHINFVNASNCTNKLSSKDKKGVSHQ